MLKVERQNKIVELANKHAIATVEELSNALCASKATIRRDLEELHHKGLLIRTFGGAVKVDSKLLAPKEELHIDVRSQLNRPEKESIARMAVTLIHEGASLFIAPGTTSQCLAKQLGCFQNLTVLTNDIDVAKEVSKTSNTLLMTGGKLKENSSTLCGFYTELVMQRINVDFAFISVDAVDIDVGFMDVGVDEISIKHMALANSKVHIMLCDSKKFSISALAHICDLSDADILVTDNGIPQEIVSRFHEINVKVVYEE